VAALVLRRPDDLRIDQEHRALRLVVARHVERDDAPRLADLDGGEPDAPAPRTWLQHRSMKRRVLSVTSSTAALFCRATDPDRDDFEIGHVAAT
jgi:hypothetical protein